MHLAGADAAYAALQANGIDVMLDDRKLSPGAKLTDLELMGFPYSLVVGRDYPKDGTVEARDLASGERWKGPIDEVVAELTRRVEAGRSGSLTETTGQLGT